MEKNNEIYLSKYSGWYSVSDEAFYTNDEVTEAEVINNILTTVNVGADEEISED